MTDKKFPGNPTRSYRFGRPSKSSVSSWTGWATYPSGWRPCAMVLQISSVEASRSSTTNGGTAQERIAEQLITFSYDEISVGSRTATVLVVR